MSFTPGTTLHVLRLARSHLSLLQVLRLEEALLRADARNWLLLYGGPRAAPPAAPTIILGVSGRLHSLVHVAAARAAGAVALRRFTGGGTVVADSGTVFASLVLNRAAAAGEPHFPRDIMAWSGGLYGAALAPLLAARGAPPFALRENDYCAGDLKFGGNAQAVSRERWVHHTSFLWRVHAPHMALLRVPEKRPAYRRDRPHSDFLTCLADLLPAGATPDTLPEALLAGLAAAQGLTLVEAALEDAEGALARNERCSNEEVALVDE